MRYILLIFLFLSTSAMCQPKIGTYDFIKKEEAINLKLNDTTNILRSINFSSLIIAADSTFIYESRTSVSCFLWYDSKGRWAFDGDNLILYDEVLTYSNNYQKSKISFRKTIFNILGDELVFVEQSLDRFSPGFISTRYLGGNYKYRN